MYLSKSYFTNSHFNVSDFVGITSFGKECLKWPVGVRRDVIGHKLLGMVLELPPKSSFLTI
jgi:hypothetical protein